MDRDDHKRYFIVGSVILEVVAPLFRTRLENDFKSRCLGSLPAFLNSQPVIHILFHLRHRNTWCCTNQTQCRNYQSLPLNYSQWELLYAESPGQTNHHCHCKFTAKPIQLTDLDITLSSLILLNCCTLQPADELSIRTLRQYKNDYLSHNTKGRITQFEYDTLWADIKSHVLQLDNTKEDELIRIENRPMDEPLCNKYITCLLDIYQKLEEMGVSIQELNDLIQRKSDVIHHLLQAMIAAIQGNTDLLQGLVSNVRAGVCPLCQQPKQIIFSNKQNRYKLGKSIFYLTSVFNVELFKEVFTGVMMEDGRVALCIPNNSMKRLLICNIDGSQEDSLQLQYVPWYVTAAGSSIVAVTSLYNTDIEVYDINTKHKLKSIERPDGGRGCGITTLNNKLVFLGRHILVIIDYQTGKVEQTIKVRRKSFLKDGFQCVHATGDKIFYNDNSGNKLHCHSYTDKKHSTTTLPYRPRSITSICDGSLYVECMKGSVQHISVNGRRYKTVRTQGFNSFNGCQVISYNQKQRKLFTCNWNGTVHVFNEIDQ